jgi:hypothetical protein
MKDSAQPSARTTWGQPLPARQLWVYDLQPQHFLERIEVAVAMQQSVTCLKAESGDETINRLAHRQAALSQPHVVSGRSYSELQSAGREDMEPQEIGAGLRKLSVITNSLQYLTQSKVGEPNGLPCQVSFKPACLAIVIAAEVTDPHGRINYNHGRNLFEYPAGAGFFKVALPMNLSAKTANRTLPISVCK